VKIAIDAMGGDFGPAVTLDGVATVHQKHRNVEFMIYGRESSVLPVMKITGLCTSSRVTFFDCSEVVEMDDKPSGALRKKKHSSMRKAVDSVGAKEAHACVSAGNTGALMGMSRFVLKRLPNINRPAICGTMPTLSKTTKLLDLGGNIDCSSADLFDFSVMGSVLSEYTENRSNPSIGLLNIGEEEMKGNEQIKCTADLLEKSPLNYVGYVEGDDIFKGVVDVIVCDGFVGNVALKASEGAAKMLASIAKEEFNRNAVSKTFGLLCTPIFRKLKGRVDPRNYNGASILGLNGTVVKSHGSADKISFAKAVEVALQEARQKIPEKIGVILSDSNHVKREEKE